MLVVVFIAIGLLSGSTAERPNTIRYLKGSPRLSMADQTASPIVGILTDPIMMNCYPPKIYVNHTQCFPATYVQWLQQAGVRVVPIPYTANQSTLDHLYSSVNGILFTGGGLNLSPSLLYYQTAQYLFRKALEGNAKGDFMPLWGTCQGFQLLSALAANNASVVHCVLQGVEGLYMPLNITAEGYTSQLYGGAPKHIQQYLTQLPTTGNFHQCGVFSSDYVSNPTMGNIFRIVSTNVDEQGIEFTSTIEGVSDQIPFFGTQWHPEETQFDMANEVSKSSQGIEVSMYYANFLRQQLRKSSHVFASKEEMERLLIYTQAIEYAVDGVSVYYFP
eukprot:PhF_6_TR25174/c0_g1_i3/m.34715/K01307/GGH; gamma-glutamyl hydrolase